MNEVSLRLVKRVNCLKMIEEYVTAKLTIIRNAINYIPLAV